MKASKFILIFSLLVSCSVVAQSSMKTKIPEQLTGIQHLANQKDTTLVRPLLAFKFAPLGVLASDPNFQFQAEYFTRLRSSVEIGLGIGSNRTFKESSKESTRIYRIEYKKYFRPFTTERRAVGYFATELSHKDILINEVAYKIAADNFTDFNEPLDFQLDANFTAVRIKYGFTFFGEQGLPIFNTFFGIGVGYKNHRNIGLPLGYKQDDFGMDLLRRTEGTGMALSVHGGISFGFGVTRRN